ncbi:MAG: hypothetical protein KAJ40_03990, partial [Alphaproteobacteria bacterium]|nr:hypothetical protein [Alphaproteobacteria bacterium]
MTSDLIEGFENFRKNAYEMDNPLMPLLVKNGQSPDYFIISCIDSRTNPGIIFNAQSGTFFAHKAMGAIIRPYKKGTALSAALQFSLKYTQVKTIIIMGHTHCGAIKALIEKLDDDEISDFINVAKQGLNRARNKQSDNVCLERRTEEEIVLLSRDNLKTYPMVKEALAKNEVDIKCWL